MKTQLVKSFKGSIYSNKTALKTLRYAADNPALVEKAATFALSTIVRPVSILMTPKTEKSEKEHMFAKSVASGAVSFALTTLLFRPVSKAMDLISNAPQKYLKQTTIDTLKTAGKTLEESKPYVFLKQSVKYTPAYLAIIPKALLTTALIAPVLDLTFRYKNIKKKQKTPINQVIIQKQDNIKRTFKGVEQKLAKLISKPLNNEKVVNFAVKHQDSNLFMNIISMKDLAATGVFALLTKKNKKIEEKNKKPLIINAFLSTALTVAVGFIADRVTKKPMEKLLDNIQKANAGDKNLPKYIEGAKVLKPIIILGSLYYAFVPAVSTFLSGKIAHRKENRQTK